ncbi:hypothetical protein A0H81_00083 [Grifola frondosa]|uniref:Micro-fibrillar-associated protein 1 C-terminal domain-containing protein n=1 Tax=Grifola frondosa TaxID=5627 RepID=A0A1C7MPN6_GRIFR|nr:hypothetical protein A0H81_00083 [Grifola frondosa]
MSTRKPAPRLPRPAARYWKGKAPKGVEAGESESDYGSEAEQQETAPEEGDILIEGRSRVINVTLRDVNISKEGRVIVGGKQESGRTEIELQEEEEEEEEEEKSVAEESSEYETESEPDEERPKLQFRPVFVPKRGRATIAEKEAMAEDTEEALKKRELQAEERKKQSHDMVAESIRFELAEKEKEEEVPDVDDSDGLDPTAEFEEWRLRELARIKRDKEEEMQREREREEVERGGALPEEQRLKEDMERAEQLRKEKPKGQQKFLQKYWHKGAFHQDEEILTRHDYTEATESTIDVSLLPQVMQVKNFGKRSRTKYTHLLDQDTTIVSGGFGGIAPVKAGGTSTAGGLLLVWRASSQEGTFRLAGWLQVRTAHRPVHANGVRDLGRMVKRRVGGARGEIGTARMGPHAASEELTAMIGTDGDLMTTIEKMTVTDEHREIGGIIMPVLGTGMVIEIKTRVGGRSRDPGRDHPDEIGGGRETIGRSGDGQESVQKLIMTMAISGDVSTERVYSHMYESELCIRSC